MGKSTMKITDFFTDRNPGVREYYSYILKLINELKLSSDGGDLVIFGGLIRDIISGMSVDELKTKDIDLYFLYYPNTNKSLKTKILRERVDSLLHNENVKVNKYNKSCNQNKYFGQGHGMIDFDYKGVTFDLSFECDLGRFDKNLDFLCNLLYVNIKDGTLGCRKYDKPLNNKKDICLKRCIEDINNRQLTSILTIVKQEHLKYKYIRHLNRRRAKMESYGYSSNPVDKEIMTKIYLSYINDMMSTFREQMDGLNIVMTERDRQQNKLIKMYKRNKGSSDNIKATIEELDESIKIYQANISIITNKIAKIARNSVMY